MPQQFVETHAFTARVQDALSPESYRQLQVALAERPTAGPVIPRSGGLRKIRWSAEGRGKRGGTRVIYYWAQDDDTILLLFIYPKNVQGDLSPAQVRQLRAYVEREYP